MGIKTGMWLCEDCMRALQSVGKSVVDDEEEQVRACGLCIMGTPKSCRFCEIQQPVRRYAHYNGGGERARAGRR